VERVISITNLKGGVGKTTLCFHFAHLFRESGKKVLLVDVDPQGNLTSCFVDEVKPENHVKLIFERALPVPLEVKKDTFLIGSNIELSKYELQVKLESYFRLKEFLESSEVKNSFDVVLIDTPPSLNIFTSNALIASHVALCVVDPGNFAISGYEEVKSLVKEVADKINPELKLFGPVFNMVKRKTRNFENLYEKCKSLCGKNLFENFIRYSTIVRDAMRSKKTVFEYCSNHGICNDFRTVFNEFLERSCRKSLSI